MNDEKWMRRAIELAKLGRGWTSPNPLVGAVIVKDGVVIGEGYHARYGDLHAERNALKHCTSSAKGADIYVTLEPCCHHGKQPPCTDALIEAGIRKVYVGSDDPNPLVAGKGIEILRAHGIEVETHFLKDECDALNKVFFHYIQNKTPYVVMKYAMSLDGKIAAASGDARWVTGEAARAKVHADRHAYTAIMAGIGTVLADDPMLNCRFPETKNPVRIICDSHLRIPEDSAIVKTARDIRTMIAACDISSEKSARLDACGCEILQLPSKDGHLDLTVLMQKLGEMGIDSILLEGGGELNWSALNDGIVHSVQAYIAPKIVGGRLAKTPVEGVGIAQMADAIGLANLRVTQIGEDLLLEGDVLKNDVSKSSAAENGVMKNVAAENDVPTSAAAENDMSENNVTESEVSFECSREL